IDPMWFTFGFCTKQMSPTANEGNNSMKLLSATIFGMIWLLPCSMCGQLVELPDQTTETDQQYEAMIAGRKKYISDSRKQEAGIALELVRLRLLIAEEKVKRAKGDITKIDEQVYQKLESEEKTLDLKLKELRSNIS